MSKSHDKLYVKGRNSNKSVVFTPARWACFVSAWTKLTMSCRGKNNGESGNYRKHHGGGWHVSVTSNPNPTLNPMASIQASRRTSAS